MPDAGVPVVIAGAGPNGLMLACELGLAGIRPIVLERLPERADEPRANGLVGQVVRMLDRRGLYERLSGSPEPPRPVPGFVFGALPLELSGLDDNPLYILPVPQPRIEQVLEERAVELGVEIRRGHELTGLSQGTDRVRVEVAGPDSGYHLTARYLVGADGGHSVTRKLAGIGFPGVTADDSVSRQANATVPAEFVDSDTGGLNVPGYGFIPPMLHHRTERGVFVWGALPSRPPMVATIERSAGPDRPDDTEPMTLAELEASVQRVLGVHLPLRQPDGPGPHVLRRLLGGNTRIAERFRDGRVLLVGDAAHVHSAIGGPGLNLGLQDAVNLGWKLAAEVRAEIQGSAPGGLLSTYETERRPAAERVVMHTQAQSALTAPGKEVTQLRVLFAELLRDNANLQHIADLMSGADVRYDMGVAAAGHWAPDLLLHTGTGPVRLAELTRDAHPLLLDLTEDGRLRDLVKPAGVRVVAARADVPATAMLLRPDCYVAWLSTAAQPDLAEAEKALARWFGGASMASSR